MKKKIAIVLALLLTMFSFTLASQATEQNEQTEEELNYAENEILVLTNYLVNLNDFEGADNYSFNGITITDIEPLFDVNSYGTRSFYSYVVEIPSGTDIDSAIETLNYSESIIAADKNHIIQTPPDEDIDAPMTIDETSDEPYQWALDEDHLDLASVREKSFTGSSDIVVAVFDGGFATHPDLTNVDMSKFYNAVLDNTDMSNADSGDLRHGNIVCGIIGANNNEIGIDGICANVTIIPIKITGQFRTNTKPGITPTEEKQLRVSSYIKAINEHVIPNNVKIINASVSMSFPVNTCLNSLIETANILFVTASGNNSLSIEDDIYQEAKLNCSPNWIVVGNSTIDNERSMLSNYGKPYVDLFAPGTNIYSTDTTGYTSDSGTSFAAPHVAAAAALIMSKATHLSAAEVRTLLINTVTKIDNLSNDCLSGGILSINNAIDALYEEIRPAYSKGDVDGDGVVDTMDYTLCRRIVMETMVPSESQTFAADVNNNGVVETNDYMFIGRFNERTYYFARTALEVQ